MEKERTACQEVAKKWIVLEHHETSRSETVARFYHKTTNKPTNQSTKLKRKIHTNAPSPGLSD